jgi:hypothetical protein
LKDIKITDIKIDRERNTEADIHIDKQTSVHADR